MPTKPRTDLRDLAPDEVFWVWRRLAGLTQTAAAKRLRWPKKRYWKAEAGELAVDPPKLVAVNGGVPPGVLCALARRRHGKRFRETARMFRISHVTLDTWEQTDDHRLVKAWQAKGYKFGRIQPL